MVNPKIRNSFPGLKIAVGVFAVYLAGEWTYAQDALLSLSPLQMQSRQGLQKEKELNIDSPSILCFFLIHSLSTLLYAFTLFCNY